jgi:hypothetical protein
MKFDGVESVLNRGNNFLQSMFDYLEDLKKDIKNTKILNKNLKMIKHFQ